MFDESRPNRMKTRPDRCSPDHDHPPKLQRLSVVLFRLIGQIESVVGHRERKVGCRKQLRVGRIFPLQNGQGSLMRSNRLFVMLQLPFRNAKVVERRVRLLRAVQSSWS